MKTIAWRLALFVVAAGGTGVYLYLAVNNGHWGAWCGAPDACSNAPELGSIMFVSALVGLGAVLLLVVVGRTLRGKPGPGG